MRPIITVDDHPYMHVAWWRSDGQCQTYHRHVCLKGLCPNQAIIHHHTFHHCQLRRTLRGFVQGQKYFPDCLFKWCPIHDFLKVTTNISSSNFVGFTTKNLKAESLLDCASRCVFWEQRSSYCNAFRCLLNNVNFKGGDT